MNRKVAGALILGVALGFSTPAISQSISDSVTVCVDWSTKQVSYSKYWQKCPAKTTPLAIGASSSKAGTQILSGEGNPANSLGSVGDFYIERTSAILFGPKTSNGWESALSLRGPSSSGSVGPAGPAGQAGPAGPAGADGADGSDAMASDAVVNFDTTGKRSSRDNLFLSFELLNNTNLTLDLGTGATKAFYVGFQTIEGGRCAKPTTSTAFVPETTNWIQEPVGIYAPGDRIPFVVELENIDFELISGCPGVTYKVYLDIIDATRQHQLRPASANNELPAVVFTSRTY